MDKSELRYFLKNGFDYINGCIKDGCDDDKKDSLYKDYFKLEEYLLRRSKEKAFTILPGQVGD